MQGNYNFNQEEAMGADAGGNGIVEGGVLQNATITRADIITRDSGSEYFDFDFKTDDGRELKYMKITTTKKNNGGNTFGHAKIIALLGLLQQQGINAQLVNRDGKQVTSAANLVGQRVGLSFYRKDRWAFINGKQELKFDMEHLHFFDAQSGQTYSEKAGQQSPETIKREVKDQRLDPNNPPSAPGAGGFGGNGGFGGQQSNTGGFGQQSGANNFGEAPQGFGQQQPQQPQQNAGFGGQQGGGFNFGG